MEVVLVCEFYEKSFPSITFEFFSDFELRALTCKDKDGDESGSAVAHDIYKAHWAKMQKL